MRDKIAYWLIELAALLMVRNLYLIFIVVPDEAAQGMIYRLLYFHVPAWWTAFLAVALSGVFSAVYLVNLVGLGRSPHLSTDVRAAVRGLSDAAAFDR